MDGPARNGACTPWISGAQVAALPLVQSALAAGQSKGWNLDADVLCAEAAVAASDTLYELSGRQFTGECGPVTIRPVARPTDIDTRSWGARLSPLGWFSAWGLSSGYGASMPGVSAMYGSSEPPTILMPYPVRQVTLVKIDGVVIPADEYELRGHQELVRIRPTANASPTQRYGWPTSQIMDLPDTEAGTFSVTFTFGNEPPALGLMAARKLAELLVLPALGDTTRYPGRLQQVTRQGVSARTTDVIDLLQKGSTGVYEIDLFLNAVNPKRNQRQAVAWSPDVGRARRQATPTVP